MSNNLCGENNASPSFTIVINDFTVYEEKQLSVVADRNLLQK